MINEGRKLIFNEFRNSELAKKMVESLKGYKGSKVTLMEVCGTHTMAIFRYGIRDILPEDIRLISGPGCPVCVTPSHYISSAIALSQRENVIITTFGDMMRIPGGGSSLLKEKAMGRDIRMVYSPLDSVRLAAENPHKQVVFLSVGFETTTPVAALTVLKAEEEGIGNFSLLSANKTIPEALEILAGDEELGVDAYIYPGHVSSIIGTEVYENIAQKYGLPGVVTGFEPLDVLHSIITLVSNVNKGNNVVENQYSRVVSKEGNALAREKMYQVFKASDAIWRGIGNIPGSGLEMREEYSHYDAWKLFDMELKSEEEPKGCMCGEVLKGRKTPKECKLFNTLCTPENPIGACMVSSEGTCAAYHKYGGI